MQNKENENVNKKTTKIARFCFAVNIVILLGTSFREVNYKHNLDVK